MVRAIGRLPNFGLVALRRTSEGYVEAEKSIAFPDLPMDRLNEFLAIGLAKGQSAAARALREWLKSTGAKAAE